jgi:hypothetical protein
LDFKRWILAAVTVALLGAAPALAIDAKEQSSGEIPYIILVIDLKPNLENLKRAGAYASDAIAATYAREYLGEKRIQPNSEGRCLSDCGRSHERIQPC